MPSASVPDDIVAPAGDEAPLAPAHTDWLPNRLRISGPAARMADFRAAAAGPGVIPWQHDLKRLREDWFLQLAGPPDGERAISLQGARILSQRLCDAVAVLQVHPWPGNIRQLRNNIERLLILATGDPAETITADMLPQEVATSNGGTANLGGERTIALPLREAREVFEREYLAAQIMRFGGNISRTAAFIGMERSALHRKLKSLGVSPARGGEEDEPA